LVLGSVSFTTILTHSPLHPRGFVGTTDRSRRTDKRSTALSFVAARMTFRSPGRKFINNDGHPNDPQVNGTKPCRAAVVFPFFTSGKFYPAVDFTTRQSETKTGKVLWVEYSRGSCHVFRLAFQSLGFCQMSVEADRTSKRKISSSAFDPLSTPLLRTSRRRGMTHSLLSTDSSAGSPGGSFRILIHLYG